MLSIERFRELVDPDGRLDETDLRELRQQMHNLAEALVEIASDRLSKSKMIEITASAREEAELN
jgi:hypothetical protein